MLEMHTEQDECWLNCEGTAIKSCHKFNKESERKRKVHNATKAFGLSSRKNKVTLFIRDAMLYTFHSFTLQTLGKVSSGCAEKNLCSSKEEN